MHRFLLMTAATLLIALSSVTASLADDDADKLVKEVSLEGIEWNNEWNTGKTEPLVVKSEDELKEKLGDAVVEKLKDQIDLSTHDLLLFQWRGSGGDKITAEVKDEAVLFQVKNGLTRDLRPHRVAFAVKKETKWKVASVRSFGIPKGRPQGKAKDS